MREETAQEVISRERGECAVCGLTIDGKGHIHHRQPRGMGGGGPAAHRLSNLLLLHASCHLQHVEQKRDQAYQNGWLVHAEIDPAEVPLMYKLNTWVLLTDDGYIMTV